MELQKVLYIEWRRNLTNEAYKFGRINKVSRIIRNSAPICSYLLKWFENWKYPMTTLDYSIALRDRFTTIISDDVVRRILNESLLLSYKKGKSRPAGLNFSKQQAMKLLFADKIIPYLSKFKMLIRIDESSFSRATKLTNSWLMKVVNQELQNICFEDSSSLIILISSSGIVFASKTSGSVNSLMFVEYLKRLKQILKEDFEINIMNCLIIMDNATTHRSKITTNFIEEKNLLVAFIPQYMPELNPIENIFHCWII